MPQYGRTAPHRPLARCWTRCLLLLRMLGRQRAWAVLVTGLLGLTGSMAVGAVRGIPLPYIHDEFSYLLAGDTFAEGRLTNPTHPHWEHFETFHVIHQPSYQSKYPPGQGLALALGQRLADEPVVGVWVSVGLMSAAIAWALLVWLPPAWAMTAALMCILQLSWFSYWAQSYWGGALAAAGGAMVLGAYKLLRERNARVLHGAILGAGLGLMALTRPFEGAIVGFLTGAWLLFSWKRTLSRQEFRQLFKPFFGVAFTLLPALGFLALYNVQVTGSHFTMPYQLHEAQYSSAPSFLPQEPVSPPEYRHAEMERFWTDWVQRRHRDQRAFPTILRHAWHHTTSNAAFFLGAGLLALLGLFPTVHRQRMEEAAHSLGTGLPIAVLSVLLLSTTMTSGAHAHYMAPITFVFFLGVGKGLLALHRRARSRKEPNTALGIALIFLALVMLNGIAVLASPPGGFALERHELAESLESMPGEHLVMVTYSDGSNIFEEWVQNHGDIDGAPVVWARSMGPEPDARLRAHFDDRTVWWLEVGDEVLLRPVEASASGQNRGAIRDASSHDP